MAISSIAGALCAGKAVEFDFTHCDDSGAQDHQVEPATADEVEAAITAFFAEFTAPRLTLEVV